jgi:hypothetical protein
MAKEDDVKAGIKCCAARDKQIEPIMRVYHCGRNLRYAEHI